MARRMGSSAFVAVSVPEAEAESSIGVVGDGFFSSCFVFVKRTEGKCESEKLRGWGHPWR